MSGRARLASTAATTSAESTRWGTGSPEDGRVEGREPVVAPAQHRHPGRLQVLERPGEVEEGLGARAHGDERVVGDGVEIGRDVAGDLRTAVDAADASGREDLDAGGVGQRQRGRDGRGAVRPRRCHRDSQVALGGLGRRAAEPVVLGGVHADPGNAVEHGRDRGGGAARPDGGDAALERVAVGRLGQAERREDRRLEGDHGCAGGEGLGHLWVHEWGQGHPGILPGGRATPDGQATAETAGARVTLGLATAEVSGRRGTLRRACPSAAPAAAMSPRRRRPRPSRRAQRGRPRP